MLLTSVVNTGSKFAAGIVDTGGKYATVSTTQAKLVAKFAASVVDMHLDLHFGKYLKRP
jgi:hypothetical protein